jgi:ATP-dependent helicase YprA (DUF1998 family)
VSVYVAFDGPLDQYFMRSPRQLFDRRIETPQVDPSNRVLLAQHLVCAATELPLVKNLDERYFGEVTPKRTTDEVDVLHHAAKGVSCE